MSDQALIVASPKRRHISTRTRFEIFKRDNFTCQYCGAHPPGVLLHIDHVIAVANGGSNDHSNLVTACETCNLGKAARPLGDRKPNLAKQAELAREREKQLIGYQRVIEAKAARLDVEIDRVQETFRLFFDGFVFAPRFRISVRVFIEKLGVHEVISAMERASMKCGDRERTLKYFCGICWGSIREGNQ